MTLIKDHIIHSIYNHLDFPRTKSAALVESLLDINKEPLASGEDVLISGFGKFCVKEKNERIGRNPQTGDDLTLGARKIVTFRYSSVLREKINERVGLANDE
jgi:integration host factor subunit alpha